MRGLNAQAERYELAEIDGHVVLFTNMRIDHNTVPEDIFCYEIRDSDDLDGSIAEIKPFVMVNHWGTILAKEPLPLNSLESYYPNDWGYLGESMHLEDFLKETTEQLAARLQAQPSSCNMNMQ